MRLGCCNNGFHSNDADVLALMPTYVKDSYRIFVTHRSAVTMDILDNVSKYISRGTGFLAYANDLKENQVDEFHRRECLYYELVCRFNIIPRVKFSCIDDKNGYSASFLSSTYIQDTWLKYFLTQEILSINGCPQAALTVYLLDA